MKKFALILALVAGCAGAQYPATTIPSGDTAQVAVATDVGFDFGFAFGRALARAFDKR